ncbi:MAG: phosphopantetheine-binding protein [Gemmataceae bacterium]
MEAALAQYPGVRECVVVAHEFAPGDARLVAYLVADPPPAAGAVREFVAAKLPPYMVPSVYVPLAALPRTPNGKLDRKALPPPVAGRPAADRRPAAPPDSPRHAALAKICADVLKVAHVAPQDSLFDLGADSLHVFQIAARAKAAGLDVTPAQILAGRTVAAICAAAGGVTTPAAGPAPIAAVSRAAYRVGARS